jgi:NIMA (never in mitosis gene a)-related kinase
LKYIVSQCLKVTPTSRPSASELLQHPKVVKNMPSSEAYNQENNQTSKAALLKTILVPKNMKNLKEALPGSKYDNSNSL